MFEMEMQVHAHHEQLAAEAARHELARLTALPHLKLKLPFKQLVARGLQVWNGRFHTEAVHAIEACCTILAAPENECVECAPAV